MKRRPSDRQMALIRRRHALRALRESVAYSQSHPENYAELMLLWNYYVLVPKPKPDLYGWVMLLGNKHVPRLSFDPFNDN